MKTRNKTPAPLPEGSVLIKSGQSWGRPAIYTSRDAVTWQLHSTHGSVYQRNFRLFKLAQSIHDARYY